MKKYNFLLLLLLPFFMMAQIPTYYNDVNLNLTGIPLKDELATKIISTHTRNLSYSQVWSSSKITDLDPSNSANVILIYGYNDNDGNYVTDRTRSKNANGGNNGTDWNREHTYAKSLGTPNLGTSGPGSDAHHLRPADVTFNGQRSSKKFATGSGNAGDSNGGWYPGDEWKGDTARMMMYMYLRYSNRCLPTNVGLGSSSSTPDAMINLFLQWNAADPVSQIEINRNNYHGNSSNSFAQGNRNPFIDNPAFATQIWGGPQAEDLFGNGGGNTDTQAPSVPTNLIATNTTQTSTDLSWNASTDNVAVTGYDIFKDGSFLTTVTTNAYNVTGLTSATTYSFTVKAKDAAGNISASSASKLVTTLASGGGGGNSSEIFFSEYIEGSSYNKALEIYNGTGNAINLAAYKIKKQSNGSGGWSSGITLNGQLTNGSVYVIANSNASSTIQNVADLSTTNGALSFNGNDAVGLFKNNVLIDIIGTFNGGSANFGKDQTLRRKATVTSPSTTFDKLGEWDKFAKNTFGDLGTHSTSGSGGNTDSQAPTTPSNLFANTITETTLKLNWNASTDNVGVTGYDVYKNGSFLGTTTATFYNVNGLTASTVYSFYVKAKDAANNVSANSNAINVNTIGSVTDILFDNSFETGWEGWFDGGSDCYRIRSSRSFDGRYSIRIRDNSGTNSAMTSSSYDVSSYDNLEITFNFYSYSMEYNEDFWVRYFDGSTWQTVQAFARGTDFNNYTFSAATVNISNTNYNFPTNAKFRFQCDASSNADQIYIDNVKVTATSGVVARNIKPNSIVSLGKTDNLNGNNIEEIETTSLFPNPAIDHTMLKAEFDIEDNPINVNILILNTQGRVIKTLNLKNIKEELFENNIDLSNLKKGLYFISITTSNGFKEIKKIVIK